jgi:transcriptional regulator GlxA family with amidase domain
MKVLILVYDGVYLLDFCGPLEIFHDARDEEGQPAFEVSLVAPEKKSVKTLQAQYPSIQVLAGERFIDNGKIITTAGVSAGIDGALHVVERLYSRTMAQKTAQFIEYDWKDTKN